MYVHIKELRNNCVSCIEFYITLYRIDSLFGILRHLSNISATKQWLERDDSNTAKVLTLAENNYMYNVSIINYLDTSHILLGILILIDLCA